MIEVLNICRECWFIVDSYVVVHAFSYFCMHIQMMGPQMAWQTGYESTMLYSSQPFHVILYFYGT